MSKIIESTFKIKNPTKDNLLNLGFRYNKYSETYAYHFPVMKYKTVTTLRGCITLQEGESKIKIDVYRTDGEDYYSPFYGVTYGNYETILKKINKSILREFKKLNIYEVE